jgi:hypothetical protein
MDKLLKFRKKKYGDYRMLPIDVKQLVREYKDNERHIREYFVLKNKIAKAAEHDLHDTNRLLYLRKIIIW